MAGVDLPVDLLVDGGGSTTRAALVRGDDVVARRDGASCNARTAGPRGWPGLLADLLHGVWREAGEPPLRAAYLAVSNAATPAELARTVRAVRRLRAGWPPLAAARCWVMNDLVPWTLRPDHPLVAVCGTGTGFAALTPDGAWVRASGLEYLLADEGGGFDIGLHGLRAVVRAHDGRGRPTLLTELVTAALADPCAGRPDGDRVHDRIHDRVHRQRRPKALVASLAPKVLAAARCGDAVAGGILDRAADELLAGVRALARRAGRREAYPLRYGGSLLAGEEPALRARFLGRLAADRRAYRPEPLPRDPLAGVRAARAAIPTLDPAVIPLLARAG
ncbi:MAG TPA: BadF/BadG/BcrA/BcrD ATPase family protein [Frankiaceae bacterium]|nr:BadF/BadG/BcrA/BcrD ATPase family protein [Frankiaceae bacterium]